MCFENFENVKHKYFIVNNKNYNLEARGKVLRLFDIFEMEQSKDDYQKIWDTLASSSDFQENIFIALIAADFVKDKAPSFKVYFHP